MKKLLTILLVTGIAAASAVGVFAVTVAINNNNQSAVVEDQNATTGTEDGKTIKKNFEDMQFLDEEEAAAYTDDSEADQTLDPNAPQISLSGDGEGNSVMNSNTQNK